MPDADPAPRPIVGDALPARLTYTGRPSTSALVRVRRHDGRRRMIRALQALAACWALALVTVLVPVLHFVLVPGFFVAGPWLAAQRLRERMTAAEARGECPGCGVEQVFPLAGSLAPRMALRCDGCGRRVFLEPGSEALGEGAG